jgi:hypothetical protein
MTKIKAYLQTFNDFELLGDALSSIYGLVDELIVVDGCYSWLADYYSAVGINPERSVDELYDTLEKSKIPYKAICKVWPTQIDKRIAGYESAAVDADYVIRFDSDELLEFHDESLNRFFSSDKLVAGMSMPTFITPNIVFSDSNGNYPVQNFIFKKSGISARNHLEYMWLVLTADNIGGEYKQEYIYDDPVAFNKHLTSWRSIKSSVNRALYYNTNWMRKHGFFHIKKYQDVPFSRKDFQNFFEDIGYKNYQNLLLTDKISIGMSEILDMLPVRRIPKKEPRLDEIYETYKNSYAPLLPEDLKFIYFSDKELFFDITSELSFKKFFTDGKLKGETNDVISEMHSYVLVLNQNLEYKKQYLNCTFFGNKFVISLSSEIKNILLMSEKTLLSVTLKCNENKKFDFVIFNKPN